MIKCLLIKEKKTTLRSLGSQSWRVGSELELGTVKIRLGPVLEKLDESYLNSNLNRNYLGRKQTVRKLHDFNGNILYTCELDVLLCCEVNTGK